MLITANSYSCLYWIIHWFSFCMFSYKPYEASLFPLLFCLADIISSIIFKVCSGLCPYFIHLAFVHQAKIVLEAHFLNKLLYSGLTPLTYDVQLIWNFSLFCPNSVLMSQLIFLPFTKTFFLVNADHSYPWTLSI